jgi:hypothetical protein
MPTLAQKILEQVAAIGYSDAEVDWTVKFITRRLLLPLAGQEDMVAERFVFEVQAPNLVTDWCNAGMVDWKTAVKSLNQPDVPIWIEYPVNWGDKSDHPGRMGFMYGQVMDEQRPTIEKPRYVLAIVGEDTVEGHLGPQGLFMMPPFPLEFSNPDLAARLVWFQDKMDPRTLTPTQLTMAQEMLADFCACLFLLQTPKLTEKRLSNFGPRKAKVQRQTGKPFVELHRVTIRVGSAEPRYDRRGSGASVTGERGRTKYHRVMPHFRTYHRDGPQPKIKLVDSFWRGDPTKGVIIKERHVKIDGPPPLPKE